MGRVAAGVRGLKLKGVDRVVGMEVVTKEEAKEGRLFLAIMENGFGKRTDISEYKSQGRGGMGIKTAQITSKTGKLVSAYITKKKDDRDLLCVSEGGQVIRLQINSISTLGRATQGVRVMRFKKAGDKVSSVTLVDKEASA